ncbi:MAG: V-type ATP synthase subunit F [Candidatus Methanodesulfokora sp.]|jgi:vacuolar-type H+-ATPase subunit F/Vma7
MSKSSDSVMAVVDDEIMAMAFEMVGIKAVVIKETRELFRFFKEEQNLPPVIFINERVAEKIGPIRTDLISRGRITPVFAVVPDMEGSRGVRLNELKSYLARAIGSSEVEI